MKKMFISCFLTVSLFVPQTFALQEEKERACHQDINTLEPGLIAKISARVDFHTKKGNEEEAEMLNLVLNGLCGDNVLYAIAVAFVKAQFSNEGKDSGFWNQIASALNTVQDLQLTEYEYDFDSDSVAIMKNMLAVSQGAEKEAWRNVLVVLSDKSRDLGSVEHLEHYLIPVAPTYVLP